MHINSELFALWPGIFVVVCWFAVNGKKQRLNYGIRIARISDMLWIFVSLCVCVVSMAKCTN